LERVESRRNRIRVPQPLVDEIAEGRCLPFIGAGFSMNAELPPDSAMPDWQGLTDQLAEAAGISSGPGPEVAARYERLFGRVGLIDAIRRALHPARAQPGAAHLAFANLSFDTIYTTNFDLLLEQAWERRRRPYRSLAGELQMPFHGGSLATSIVKMHGDIRHEEHIVVTKRDYDNFLDSYPVVATHLSAMLITRTGLFVGYSRTDPDFTQINDVVRSRLGRFHRMSYLIDFGVPPEEVEQALEDQIHIVSLSVPTGAAKGDVLADFFDEVQRELDLRASRELRLTAPDIFEDLNRGALERTYNRDDAGQIFESTSSLCFVLIPFSTEFELTYRQIILPAAQRAGLTALRAADLHRPGLIGEQIRVAIQQARVCVVDLTESNPNVLYELGLAQALGKPVVLLAREGSELPFDVRSLRVLFYRPDDADQAIERLERMVSSVLRQGRIDAAERLVESGSFRAAIAELGVTIEFVLYRILREQGERNERDGWAGRQHRASIGAMAAELARRELIEADEADSLKEFARIRNSAVHDLKEPERGSALQALAIARKIAGKYASDI
jgi:hypothetical protein